jgi:RNA polymerase sigma factor (sigma-70 family)
MERRSDPMDEILRHESPAAPMKFRKAEPTASGTADVHRASRSFETLFSEHWARIYRLLLRLVGDPAEAEDLALETFLRLYRRGAEPEEDFNTAGWLHRVATNLGLQAIRNYKRRERYELAAGKNALDEASENRPAEVLASAEERRLARAALACMNPRRAQLLVMRYSGMAYKEIAAALALSPASIGPLLLRAEREFERRYGALTQEEP